MTVVRDVPGQRERPVTGEARRPCDIAAEAIADRAAGEAYVASICFKHGPPRRVGVELEYTVHYREDAARPLRSGDLIAALGPYAPRTLWADSPALPLPAGSPLSLEPGGQVELSPPPQASLNELAAVVDRDLAYVRAMLDRHGLVLGDAGTDVFRPPAMVLRTKRYEAMERRFSRSGVDGKTMMCATAALQVCVDTGEREQLAARWAALHAMGPAMVALFANSPRMLGRETGFASSRWHAVMGTEPARTTPLRLSPDPVRQWASRVLDTPLLVRRADGHAWDAPAHLTFAQWINREGAARELPAPTAADLDYHVTTLFTPVRPRGYLEVRYLDAQPAQDWLAPVALLSALVSNDAAVDASLALCGPTSHSWVRAARAGMRDADLAQTARSLVELGCANLDRVGLHRAAVESVTDSLLRKARAA